MNAETLRNLVHTPWAKALGWTLFHSLWEGAIAAFILLVALSAIRSARARYAAACLAMLAIVVAFAVTLGHVIPVAAGPRGLVLRMPPAAPPGNDAGVPASFAGLTASDVLPWLTPFWILGVVLFHLRSLVSWMAARRLRRYGTCPAPDAWVSALARLQTKLRLSQPVALLESAFAEVPAVIGYLRPAILVPAGMLAGMPAAHIEAILIHELAHIRRHDYLVNVLQNVVEGFLFYNPAVWWISSMIRAERENCCDDVVVSANGNAPEYAAALAALERNRQIAGAAALAATGGHLMKRIRRLLYPLEQPRTMLTPVVSLAVLTFTGALALMAWQTPQMQPGAALPLSSPAWQSRPLPAVAQLIPSLAELPLMTWQTPQAPKEQLETPWKKWLNEDVAYVITDEERKAFKALQTDDERVQFVEQFWQRRNPTPGSPDNPFRVEHYRRIVYANAHFGTKTSIPGWKTDRGRIYIMFGPPDELDEHATGGAFERPAAEGGGAITTVPFEDWRYRFIQGIGAEVTIEFVDSGRNGEYHMAMDPNEKDAIRYAGPPPQ